MGTPSWLCPLQLPQAGEARPLRLEAWARELGGELSQVLAERKERFRELRCRIARALYVRREMQAHQACGVKPFQVLQAATRNAAEYQGESAHWGTVGKGRRADLVLLDTNPLEDVKNAQTLRGVVLRGRWIPREQLQAPLKEIAQQLRPTDG